MNLIVENDLKNEKDFDIILLINSISESKFNSFIKKISSKSNWSEELCCCYFETSDNSEYYRFETFEGNSFKLTYDEFLYYVRLAIIRYFLECKTYENKKILEDVIKNTILSPVLNEIDESLSTGFPLVFE